MKLIITLSMLSLASIANAQSNPIAENYNEKSLKCYTGSLVHLKKRNLVIGFIDNGNEKIIKNAYYTEKSFIPGVPIYKVDLKLTNQDNDVAYFMFPQEDFEINYTISAILDKSYFTAEIKHGNYVLYHCANIPEL